MREVVMAVSVAFGLTFGATLLAADPQQTAAPSEITLKGEVVDALCYSSKGIAAGTGAQHMMCAKECAKKDGAVFGILTDGDGLFKIVGEYAADHYAKLFDYIGKEVEVVGTRTRSLDYSTAIKVTRITALAKKSS
jgi:hypothetical protein